MASSESGHRDAVRIADPHRAQLVVLTGLPGAGKSTLAGRLHRAWLDQGRAACILDGDALRRGLGADLGFSEADRQEHARRVACLAGVLLDAGVSVVVAMILPSHQAQASLLAACTQPDRRLCVHVSTSLAICEARDPKGLYARARRGELQGLTGLDAPYQVPEPPCLTLDAGALTPEQSLERLLQHLGLPPDRGGA